MEKHWKQHYTAVILQTNVSVIPNFDSNSKSNQFSISSTSYAVICTIIPIENNLQWLLTGAKMFLWKESMSITISSFTPKAHFIPLHISHPLLSRAGYVPQEALYYGTFLLSYYGMPPEAQTFNNVPNWIRNLEGNCIRSRGILVELKINILLHGWNEMNRCWLRLRCCWSNGRWRPTAAGGWHIQ